MLSNIPLKVYIMRIRLALFRPEVIKPDAIHQGQKDGKTVDQVLEVPETATAAVGHFGSVGY